MLEVNDFNAIHISLASPEQVRGWSYGEVTKPETINYRTFKPEQDGLVSERIFGPTKDWACSCGKYKGVRFNGIVCDKCRVVVARSRERRFRDLSDALGSVFRAGMGAEAVRELLAGLDLDALAADLRRQISSTASQRRKKATKRLKVVEAFRRSGTSPEWMILTVLPVL